MSSSYLLNLKINQIQEEILAIGTAVGYYWDFIPNGDIVVTGSQTAANVATANGNDSAWAYSNLPKSPIWTITFEIPNDGTNSMFVGVGSSVSSPAPYTGTSPSMNWVQYGMLIDQNFGSTVLEKIENGVTSNTSYKIGQYYKITYDGTTLKYYVNNVNVISYTVELQPIYLMVGSYNGGVVNAITFESTTIGGGVANENLQQVLTNGNDGGGLDIDNVGTINANVDINANNDVFSNGYLRIGNRIGPGTSFLLFCYGNGNEGGTNYQVGAFPKSGTAGRMNFYYYPNGQPGTVPLTIDSDTGISTPFPVTAPSYSILNGTTTGVAFDNVSNFPTILAASSVSNIPTKLVSFGTDTSILHFNPPSFSTGYNQFTLYFPSISFNFTVTNNIPAGLVTIKLYLSDTVNAPFDPTNALNVSYVTPNLNPNGGTPAFLAENVMISFVSSTDKAPNGVFLNVYTVDNGSTAQYYFANLTFTSQLTASFVHNESYTPEILT